MVELALAAREHTAGRFDPTVHDALVAAGYDRSFDDLPGDAPDTGDPRDLRGCGDASRADASGSTPGVRLDLGGIGKGFAAERVAELLAAPAPAS